MNRVKALLNVVMPTLREIEKMNPTLDGRTHHDACVHADCMARRALKTFSEANDRLLDDDMLLDLVQLKTESNWGKLLKRSGEPSAAVVAASALEVFDDVLGGARR